MKSERQIATLVPYCLEDGVLKFFLQKRDQQAPRYPGYFGFFGGHVEPGESPGEALVREVKEELCIDLRGHWSFGLCFRSSSTNYLYALEVTSEFPSQVTVLEGEYGRFCTPSECVEFRGQGILLLEDFIALQKLAAIVQRKG